MINRRKLLAGLGFGAGAALLHPFFRQAFANGPAPCRFVLVVEGNCIEPTCFMSAATRAEIAAQATGSIAGKRWMQDRYGHSSRLVVQQGDLATATALAPLGTGGVDLTSRASVVLGLSSTITGGGHSTHYGALSCSRSTPARPAGQTIDSWLAERVAATTPFDAVRVGIDSSGGRLSNATCAIAAGRPAPVTIDPRLAYDNLFGFIPGSSGASSFGKRSDLLDFAYEDVTMALGQFGGNSRERAKLEQYLASVEVIRQRQQTLTALGPTFDPNDPLAPHAPEDPSTNPLYASTDHLDQLRAQFENVTAALIGGLTNVAVITSGTGDRGFGRMVYGSVFANHPAVDNQLERHDLHHGSAGNQPYIDAIHDVTRTHVEMVAALARALEATPEAGGTMLDNTVILFLSDNGEQHHSTATEWPCLLIGGDNLGFHNDGRTVVYPGSSHANNRQLSNLFNSLGYAAGSTLDDFGHEGGTRVALGPLDDVWT